MKKTEKCGMCGKQFSFTTKRGRQPKYCSKKCAKEAIVQRTREWKKRRAGGSDGDMKVIRKAIRVIRRGLTDLVKKLPV